MRRILILLALALDPNAASAQTTTDCNMTNGPLIGGNNWQMHCRSTAPPVYTPPRYQPFSANGNSYAPNPYGAAAAGLDAVRRNMELNAQLQAQQEQAAQMEAIRRQNQELIELQRRQLELMQQQQGNWNTSVSKP